MGLSRAALYYAPRLPERDWALKVQIELVLREHPGYGSRRVALALGMNRKRAQRVMKLFGIKAYRRRGRRFRSTCLTLTKRYGNLLPTSPDLPLRQWAGIRRAGGHELPPAGRDGDLSEPSRPARGRTDTKRASIRASRSSSEIQAGSALSGNSWRKSMPRSTRTTPHVSIPPCGRHRTCSGSAMKTGTRTACRELSKLCLNFGVLDT